MNASKLTVFVIDDDAAVRRSLMMMIEQEEFYVQNFESAESFLDAYRPTLKGCIITDVQMPGINGLTLQEVLYQRKSILPIIFLTGYGSIPMSVKAVKAGAIDFLTKPITRANLLLSIKAAFVEYKKMLVANNHHLEVNSRLSKLTEREREIMNLVLQSCSNKKIATQLGISHRTVEIHRSNIMRKTGAANLLDLAQIGQEGDQENNILLR